MNRTTSTAVSSHRSSIAGSSAVPIEIYPHNSDPGHGEKYSCHIRPRSKSHLWKKADLGYLVTLRRAGQPDCTRFLVKPKETLATYPTFPNRDRGGDWRPSLIDGRDQDPTGKEGESTPPALQDPGWLVDLYERKEWKCCGSAFDCLEVLARADMKGPWMIRPIPREKPADLYTAKRDARLKAQATYWEEQRKKQEEAERDARAFMNSARRGSDNAAARLEAAAASGRHRRGSSGSLASVSAKKGPRTSITSVATNETATPPANGKKSTSLLRHGLLRKKGNANKA